jgi:ABC-type branched-subunit amino acid transport system substrate-binding protein
MRQTRVRRVGALLVGLAFVAASCGSDDEESDSTTAAPVTTAAAAATTATTEDTDDATTTSATEDTDDATATTSDDGDGATATTSDDGDDATATTGTGASGDSECGQASSDVTDGDLAGFAGATPFGKGGVNPEFIARLCEIDPNLIDLNYGAETYDAVTVIALAVAQAEDDGIAYASLINGITRDGEKCDDFVSCMEIIEAGGDVDYDGVSGPLTFTGAGEPLEASYGFLTMGDNNRIDPALTEFIDVRGPASSDVEQVPVEGQREGDGTLKIGTILPQTGSLAFLGPPEFAAFELAVDDINAAGGVLGKDVVGIKGDSGDTTTDTASKTVDRLLAEDVDAIIGAASSGVSLTVIDKITGAGVVQFSPANTSPELTTYDDKGLYFRTAPPDVYQGNVLGQKIVEDGNQNVAFIVRNDSYGNGLLEEAVKAVEDGGGTVVATKIYDEKATSFDTEVDEIAAQDPDAVVVIGFEESSKILRTMVEKGIGPRDVSVYGCDGNAGNGLGVTYDAGE